MGKFNVNRYIDIVIKTFKEALQKQGYIYINNSKTENALGIKVTNIVEKAFNESSSQDEFEEKIEKIKKEMEIAANKLLERYKDRKEPKIKVSWVKNTFKFLCEEQEGKEFEFLCGELD